MTSFHYPLPEQEPQSPWTDLSDEARSALTKVAIGSSVANQLLQPDGLVNPEISPDFQMVAAASHRRYNSLFTEVPGYTSVPEFTDPEFSQVDWQRLESGFMAYDQLGMSPELVISIEGQPLDRWQTFYSNLRQYQDDHYPDSPHRLLRQNDGDGLFVNAQMAEHWGELTPEQTHWSLAVIPTTIKAPALGVDYYGKGQNGLVSDDVASILTELPINQLVHPTIESYLAFQASRIHANQQPIDDKIDGLFYYTWLRGNFTNSENNQVAPRGGWRPDFGQVFLVGRRVGNRVGDLGVRPEVRGEDL